MRILEFNVNLRVSEEYFCTSSEKIMKKCVERKGFAIYMMNK